MKFETGYVEMDSEILLDLADQAVKNLENYREIKVHKEKQRIAKKSWWNRDSFCDKIDLAIAATIGSDDMNQIETVQSSLMRTEHGKVFVSMEALRALKFWANRKINQRDLDMISSSPLEEDDDE